MKTIQEIKNIWVCPHRHIPSHACSGYMCNISGTKNWISESDCHGCSEEQLNEFLETLSHNRKRAGITDKEMIIDDPVNPIIQALKDITRVDINSEYDGEFNYCAKSEKVEENGEYVRYEDIKKIINKFK